MAETDEQRAGTEAIASSPAIPNPNDEVQRSRTREEGELSASDDDEVGICSTGNATLPPRPVSMPPAVKGSLENQEGKAVPGTNLKSTSDAQTQRLAMQPMNKKNIDYTQVPLKSANPARYAPSGGNKNLVIRFSDDSGSDSDEYRKQKTIESKSNSSSGHGDRRPVVSSVVKVQKSGPNGRDVSKVIPKNLPSNHTSGSSMTKTYGAANSRGAVSSAISQGSRGRYFSKHSMSSTSPEYRNNQVVGSNSSEVQDLRQQIALKESELKLKAAQNKEIGLASTRDSRKWVLDPAEANLSEPKEPDKKRLKVGESDFTHLKSDGQREVAPVKPNLPSKVPDLEKRIVPNMNEVDQRQKVIPMSRSDIFIVRQQKHDNRAVDNSFQNISNTAKDGDNIHSNIRQPERSKRLVDSSVLSNLTTKQVKVTPSNLPKNVDLNHPSKVGAHNLPRLLINKETSEQNLANTSSYHAVECGDKMLEPSLKNKHQASPENAAPWNSLSTVNVSPHGNIDMQSLTELEEKLDKELEDAQELRRSCEIEERNALKAYRKAQRTLIEANARCTELYRQREFCAARFRSFLVDESNVFWSSRGHESSTIGLDTSNSFFHNMDLVPASSQQFQHGYRGFNQPDHNPIDYHAHVAPHNLSYKHGNGSNLGSEQCSEPDDSASKPLPHNSNNTINGIRSPCSDFVVSVDEDEETSLMDHDSIQVQPSFEHQQKNQTSEVSQRGNGNESKKAGSQDSLLLEATLRSELFARMGMRALSKNLSTPDNVQPAVDRGAESDVGSEKTQMSNGSATLPEAEKKIKYDGGPEGWKRITSESPIQNEEECQTEKTVLKVPCAADSEENGSSIGYHFLVPKTFTPPFLVRSTFGHVKVISHGTSAELLTGHGQIHTYNFDSQENACIDPEKTEQGDQTGNLVQETLLGFSKKGKDHYTCSLAVDPSRPFCMYELRGKCNNDECTFQHVRDFSDGNMIQPQCDVSNSEFQVTSHQQQCNDASKLSKYNDALLSPTYVVCLDSLKADPHTPESILAWRSFECWWKCFSLCLALTSSFQKGLSGYEMFLDGCDGHIQAHSSWNSQISYFQSRNGILNKLNQAFSTTTQSLETALFVLKAEGITKALSVLSRALEADQTSETLWTIYLLICYSDRKLAGMDDMFLYAVKNNQGSYLLWLLYINSRQKLSDQLNAYDAALSALCHYEYTSDKDGMYTSACILDLFLQMINCFCMSGNVDKAIQRIFGLLPASDESHSMMLTDILKCLTFSDKCIFWTACVYLVLYRKLPESVVEQFEYEKELLPIDWPSVKLSQNEKQGPLKLLEATVNSIELFFNDEMITNVVDLRSAQIFALNHIRCMVALEGTGCFRNLWERYVKLYPSCLELVLMSARTRKNDCDDGFVGFEDALREWPKDMPGIQCIWNQYAEYAFHNEEPDFVKKLMERWHDSVWRVKYPQNEIVDAANGSTSKQDFPATISSQLDIMFGLLNLSLHKFLQNDSSGAQVAIDQALNAAGPEGFEYCIKEHATSVLTNEFLFKEDARVTQQLNTLRVYLDAARTFPTLEPLSRKFINDIEKPRLKQLVSSILSPVSSDSSIVNLVLEAWYGPSLFPPQITKAKNLVDFVEAILEITPSNYRLVISLCKLLSSGCQYSCFASPSILFWASSTLMNAIFFASPIPPEHVWVEAALILSNILGTDKRHETFYKKALSAYPFSLKLWQCYHDQSKTGDRKVVVESAKERGIELN